MDVSDPRWSGLRGGYGVPYDPRPALQRLASGEGQAEAWAELWQELHHQGDIGDASLAAVTVIADLASAGQNADWNAYALAAIIEEARREKGLPLPQWLTADYAAAWRQIFEAGVSALSAAQDEALICSILAALAHHKNQPMLGRMALLTERERAEMLAEVGWA